MWDIITVGSGTIDVFMHTEKCFFVPKSGKVKLSVGSKVIADRIFHSTGGGGTNTAVSFARLGLKAAFLGKLGKDNAARQIVEELKNERVDTSLVSRSDTQTGYSVVLDACKTDHVILCYKGANDEFKPFDVHEDRLKSQWFYLGSLMGDSFRILEKVAAFAEANDKKIAFNPSYYLAEKGAKALSRILSKTNILILNQDEAYFISRKRKPKDMAKKLFELGCSNVVITNGSKEVTAYDGTSFYTAKPNKVKVEETTGAGDAFGSGFVAGMIKTNDIEFSIQLGIVNSEAVIQHVGAKNSLLKLGEALKLMRKHRVKVKKSNR